MLSESHISKIAFWVWKSEGLRQCKFSPDIVSETLFFLFIGLTVSEAAKLCSYMHFRDPKLLLEKTLLQRANLDKSIDFMDSIEEDCPKGSLILHILHFKAG